MYNIRRCTRNNVRTIVQFVTYITQGGEVEERQMMKRFRAWLEAVEAREARELEDSVSYEYRPSEDTMAQDDGGPSQYPHDGILSRFEKSWGGKIAVGICWMGMIFFAIVAVNLLFGRPWF